MDVGEAAEQVRALDIGKAAWAVVFGDPYRQGEAQPEEAGEPGRLIAQGGRARRAARRRLPLDQRSASGVEVNTPGEVEAVLQRCEDHGLGA